MTFTLTGLITGIIAFCAFAMGALSFAASIYRIKRNQLELGNQSELCAIGWFILVVMLVK